MRKENKQPLYRIIDDVYGSVAINNWRHRLYPKSARRDGGKNTAREPIEKFNATR
jgi:hypothetical protein